MKETQPSRQLFVDDPHRPLYHYVAPAHFLGDPNGTMYWKGRYHLFYQYNPHGAYDRSTYMHWGHAVSRDLVHWEDLPIALTPEAGNYDRSGCWSGGAFTGDGVPTLIYYGHPGGSCLATSNDEMVVWEKHPANPVIPHQPKGFEEYVPFDPCMWKEGDTYYSLAGGSRERVSDGVGDTAYLFKSLNMVDWDYLGPLYESLNDPPESDCAVPDFFPLGDRHMLLFASHKRGAQYYIGRWENERFQPQRHGRLNFGDFTLSSGNAMAPLTLRDDNGRRIAFCWIAEGITEAAARERGWSGIISLPQQYSLFPDNALRIEPVVELQALRGNPRERLDLPILPDDGLWLPEVNGRCLELQVDFRAGDADTFGIGLFCSPDLLEQTSVVYDRSDGTLALDAQDSSLSDVAVGRGVQRAPLDLDAEEALRLRIFIDRSVVEVFANERLCLSKRAYPTRPDSTGVRLFATGGTAVVASLKAWDMAAVWPTA